MKTIGVDSNNYLVYEGVSRFGHAIWPTPILIPALIVDESQKLVSPKNQHDLQQVPFLFIDDGYDPTSRIRKGRIYQRSESQPCSWRVNPHPAMPTEFSINEKQLITFLEFNFYPKLKQLNIKNPLIILGAKSEFTVWSVIDVESSISGETVIYLKARRSLGVLPKINFDEIPLKHRTVVRNKLDILLEDVHRAGPESIVDCCREAATAILGAYLDIDGKDLADLIKKLNSSGEKKVVTESLAQVIARFHPRRKHAAQSKDNLRRITEQDAELSVNAIGVILAELKWVKT